MVNMYVYNKKVLCDYADIVENVSTYLFNKSMYNLLKNIEKLKNYL